MDAHKKINDMKPLHIKFAVRTNYVTNSYQLPPIHGYNYSSDFN